MCPPIHPPLFLGSWLRLPQLCTPLKSPSSCHLPNTSSFSQLKSPLLHTSSSQTGASPLPLSLSLSQPLLASQPPPWAYPHGLSDSPALTSPVPIRPSWQSRSGVLPFSPCDIPQTDAQSGSLHSTAGTSEHTRVVTPMCHNERPPGKLVSPFSRKSTSGLCSLLSPTLSLP